jgi:PAS domain S-box-containing protein
VTLVPRSLLRVRRHGIVREWLSLASASRLCARLLLREYANLWGTTFRVVAGRGAEEQRVAGVRRPGWAARAAEARCRDLVQLSPDAIGVVRDGRIEFANSAALELLGASSPQELLGKSPFDLVHADDHPLMRERILWLLGGKVVVTRAEITLLRLDGTTRRVEVNARAFDDAAGRAIEAVLRDVTEHRRAEEALRVSEERLRAHIDNSPLAVIEFDPEFTVMRWSKEAERVFGWPADEMIGRKIPDVRWVHESDLESVRREASRLLTGEQTRTLNVNRNYRNDGSTIYCEWYNSALHDARGRLISILSQVLDVTDRQRTEQELRASQEALRAADQRKTDFLAILSHEIRNDLAPMKHGLRLLERTSPASPQFHRAREIIGRQIDHVTGLVDDLLDVSRINTGKLRLARTRFDARAVVHRICEDFRAAFEERGLALRLEIDADLLWVEADEARLTQIVGNLLGNALKFTSPPGTVEVAMRKQCGAIELRVRDTGAGIEPRFLDGIFDPFTQPERTRGTAHGGMGLGLALVKELVTMHGGTVRAASEGKGRGAEFIVTLPLAPAPEVRASRPLPVELPSLAILIVEDNRDAAEMLEQILQLEGHRIRVAFDGQSATEAFREFAPEVLISDVGLPDVSGYDLMRRLRMLETGSPVFAIAMSGYAQADDVERAREAGFDAHLAKPASLERLDGLLAEAASRRSEERPSSSPAPIPVTGSIAAPPRDPA